MAVNDAIVLVPTSANQAQVALYRQLVASARNTLNLANQIRDQMRHQFSDAGGNENAFDWSAIEAIWGVPVNAGNGGTPSVGPNANGKRIFTFVDGTIIGMSGDAKGMIDTVI